MKTIRRCETYLNFIRKQECCVTGHRVEGEVCAHHVRLGASAGTGIKPSDFRCVPLCHSAHQELHQLGEKAFWGRAGKDPHELILGFMMKFAAEKRMGHNVLIMALENEIANQLQSKFHAVSVEECGE